MPATLSARVALHSIVLAAVGICVFGAIAPPALGEPVPLTGAPMEVQVWPGGEAGYMLFIVTGRVPADVALPAVVRFPLPANAQVLWSGEILGGRLEDDPARQYSVVETPTGRAIEFTAEETRTVQYEAVGYPLAFEDGLVTARFEWVQSVPVDEVVFSVRVPATAEVVNIDPEPAGPPAFNEGGDRLYVLTPLALPEGARQEITVAYGDRGAGGTAVTGGTVLRWAGLALGFAVAALAVVLVWEKRRRANT